MRTTFVVPAILVIVEIFSIDVGVDENKIQDSPSLSFTRESSYLSTLNEADSSTFVREFESPFLFLLTDNQKNIYHLFETVASRKDYIITYWKRENPNPFSDENLWLEQFLDRLEYVKKHFAIKDPPYLDDRAKWYLRLGEPYRRNRFVGKIPSREIWYYKTVKNLKVYFMKIGSKYEEENHFSIVRNGGGRLASLRAASSIELAKLSAPDYIVISEEFINADLDFSYDIAQFRGSEKSTALDVTVYTPLKKNAINDPSLYSGDTLKLSHDILLRNASYDPLFQTENNLKLSMNSVIKENSKYAINNMRIFAPPIYGDFALHVKNSLKNNYGIQKRNILIRDFSGDKLMVSDIQFYSRIENAEQYEIYPITVKRDEILISYPSLEIFNRLPVLCYFEIYNIRTSGIVDNYLIELQIEKDTSRDGVLNKISEIFSQSEPISLSLSYKRIVTFDDDTELIELDLSSLDAGHYILTVKISDSNKRNINTEVTKSITVI